MKMIQFKATLSRFNKMGEKTGWTYIEIPADIANELFPGNRKSFRVKGYLDAFEISAVALIPMGQGAFILPVNAQLRKGIGKRHGSEVKVKIEKDISEYQINSDLLECLEDDSEAKKYFSSLPRSHQNYYSKWIESAKTVETKSKRIALCVNACARRMSYSEMIREDKRKRLEAF
mgnify:CR=1 FL=1